MKLIAYYVTIGTHVHERLQIISLLNFMGINACRFECHCRLIMSVEIDNFLMGDCDNIFVTVKLCQRLMNCVLGAVWSRRLLVVRG